MPLSPTDPRTYADADMPLPPTMEGNGLFQGGNVADMRPRFVPTASSDNGGRRSPDEKPLDRYAGRPNASPYFLVYGNAAYPTNANVNSNATSGTSTSSTSGQIQSGPGSPIVKPFDSYNPPPAMSPYMLINSNTANGTISTYNAYVRPALAQQANQNELPNPAAQGGTYLSAGLHEPGTVHAQCQRFRRTLSGVL